MYIPTRKVLTLAALGALALIQGCDGDGPGAPGGTPPPGAVVPQCPESETRRLADGVFAFRRGLYASMFVVGQGGIIAFDPLASEAACLDRAIRDKAPGLLVQHLVYTHAESDHIAGGRLLPLSPAVRVYAHRQAADEVTRRGVAADIVPVTDVLDVNADGSGAPLQLTLLGRRLSLTYFGPTQGSGNLTVYLPDDKVAMLVDVLLADTVPGTLLASVSPQGVLRTLAELDRLPVRDVVVGHGPPASHADVSRTLAYWSTYVSQLQGALRQSPISIPDADALEGAPLLKILPQLPAKAVLDALRPYYLQQVGFESWGKNGMDFAYLFLTGESAEAVTLRAVGGLMPPPRRWEKVGEGAYYAQVGAYGSLVIDPDPEGKEALVVVDPLGENAAILRDLLRVNMPGRRVGHVIYSHAHNDHIAHAAALCDGSLSGVRIYAHENAARDLRDRKNPSVALPTDIISGKGRDLQIGGQAVSLRWYGPSHGDGNLVVWLPGARVAMAVGLVQRGALPGLLSVEMDAAGMYRALTGMLELPAQVYLTGQGGWMSRDEFGKMVSAARDLLVNAAAAMKADATGADVPLALPVAPALRGVVDVVAGKVSKSLSTAYPMLMGLSQGPLGELGVNYCVSQSATLSECQVQ